MPINTTVTIRGLNTFQNWANSLNGDGSKYLNDAGEFTTPSGSGSAGTIYVSKTTITYAEAAAALNNTLPLITVEGGDIILDVWFRLLEEWDTETDVEVRSGNIAYVYISPEINDTAYLDSEDDPNFASNFNTTSALRSFRDTNIASGAGSGYFTFPLIAKQSAVFSAKFGNDVNTASQGQIVFYVMVARAPTV